jgi:hypothetical protein
MSHLHQGTYTDKKQLVAYINGFLWTLEILNDYVDHGQTYYVEELPKGHNLETTIINHLGDNRYKVSYSQLTDWKTEIDKTAREFFGSWLHRLKYDLKEDGFSEDRFDTILGKSYSFDFELVFKKYIQVMEELITEDSVVYEVIVDDSNGCHYANYFKDYLVDNRQGLFFIHFGISD